MQDKRDACVLFFFSPPALINPSVWQVLYTFTQCTHKTNQTLLCNGIPHPLGRGEQGSIQEATKRPGKQEEFHIIASSSIAVCSIIYLLKASARPRCSPLVRDCPAHSHMCRT